MSHLNTLLICKAKSVISGMGYSKQFYSAAWSILERQFGRPHVIIDAQLTSLRQANQVKPHYSVSWFHFSVTVSNFVNCSRSTNKLVICNQVQRCIWQLIIYHRYSKRNGGSMLMTRTRTGLI